MSSFPGSPRVMAGAIVAVEPTAPLARIAVFQYNPDEVTRSLRPRGPAAGAASASDALRVWGAATETVTMTIELDATDGLEAGDAITQVMGVAGRLAVLEMQLYPSTAQVIARTALTAAGVIEVLPPTGPLTVLVWGPGRVVPVRVDSLTIREQAFDTLLNPIRAAVDLSLTVLTYDDFSPTDVGFAMSLVHQVQQEVRATVGGLAGIAGALAGSAGVSVSVGG
ncbi:hypothetical protein [Cellulomonas sp. Leaf395]|uniref:hypothetical protein n=1 Tax=Cellulomonas sp. Leaf395 TaxID=1736362 RepID=UPI0006FF6B06|nr:hypothetical protein [Cellulomonas sp. Leaf395]KQS97454.1 hypothetical protein ASG23_18170 [Cellulomonas sp. Leaf395]